MRIAYLKKDGIIDGTTNYQVAALAGTDKTVTS
jgi:hypothetical protein